MEIGSGSSVLGIGLRGLQQSSQSINQSANEIAQAGTLQASREGTGSTQDLVEPLVNMKIEQNIFDASANVVKVGDEMIGSILDIKA
jgi:flagellar hook protein FlgE